ncbi:hypothetical protein RUM43_007169, partial [Polyplax serrata]
GEADAGPTWKRNYLDVRQLSPDGRQHAYLDGCRYGRARGKQVKRPWVGGGQNFGFSKWARDNVA